jgi:hypothetical protein
MIRRVILLFLFLAGAAPAWAQSSASSNPPAQTAPGSAASTQPPASGSEPATREEELRREREQKDGELKPYEQGGVEKGLVTLEQRRLLERLLVPPQGFYPAIGAITGGGFSGGAGYRKAGFLTRNLDFNASASGTIQSYWLLDARVSTPSLLNPDQRFFGDFHVRRWSYPSEEFFGVGADSARSDLSSYDMDDLAIGGRAGIRIWPWLSVGGAVEHLQPRTVNGKTDPVVGSVFEPSEAPGFEEFTKFFKYEEFLDVNYTRPGGNPRRGGRYRGDFRQFADVDLEQYSFRQVEMDLQQYIPFFNERRVIALHANSILSYEDPNQLVPFYYMPTLGGASGLRGFHRHRFRDRNAMVLQAEYRFEVFPAMDGAVFYDTGRVAARKEDLFEDREKDWGFGVRFGTANAVFMRIEVAFGSSAGTHFIWTFSNAF